MGGALGFALNDEPDNPSNFYAGIWTRFNNVNDAIIPYVGLEFQWIPLRSLLRCKYLQFKNGFTEPGWPGSFPHLH
jgi:hypothetical protein